jgi:IMP cyclohydrolase
MIKGLELLSGMEYPGRVILIGADPPGKNAVVVYAVTGRSRSSQARKIVAENKHFLVVPTDEAVLKEGNHDLLIYPAICVSKGIVVSNGKQTGDILAGLHSRRKPLDVLRSALSRWDYEPDPPSYTPRICGCLMPSGQAALGIVRRVGDGRTQRDFYDFSIKAGFGKVLTTYAGENREPLPSYAGAPGEIEVNLNSAEEMAEAVYTCLGGKKREGDFRVAVACVFGKDLKKNLFTFSIVNRHERTGCS